MDQEIWRPVEGWQNAVEVSNFGGVRVFDGRTIAPYVTRYGYHEVQFRVEGQTFRNRVHRLVAKAFVRGQFKGATVDHLDCNKINNRADNLEWVSASENTKRQHEAGILSVPREANPTAKLTDLQAHAIRILYHHNFPPALLGEWFGVSESCTYQLGKDGKPPLALRSRKSPTIAATKRHPALFD